MNNLHRIDPLGLEDNMKVAIVQQINTGRRVRFSRTKVKRELRVQYYEAGYWGGGSWYTLAPTSRHWHGPAAYERLLAQYPGLENQIGRSQDF